MSQFVVLKTYLNVYINNIIGIGDKNKMNNKKNIIILSGVTEESLVEKSENICKKNNIYSYTISSLQEINKRMNIEDILSEYLINDETLIEMDIFNLTTLNIKRLQENNIIISKIIFVIENPKILAETIAKKLNIRWTMSQAEKYQETKIKESMSRVKKHNINCDIYINEHIPNIKIKQI